MKSVTINDIAKKVGVTTYTVSMVLNKKESPIPISKATRNNVLQAAEELNYQPNFQARNLKKQRSYLIGVNLPQGLRFSESSYITRLQYGLGIEIDKSDYELVFHSSILSVEEAVNLVRSRRLDGYIYVVNEGGLAGFTEKTFPVLAESSIPFIVIHNTRQDLPFNNVGYNSFEAGYLGTRHLIKLGHKNIGLVGGSYINTQYTTEMKAGYLQALQENGLAAENSRNLTGGVVFDDQGYGRPRFVLAGKPDTEKGRPTAYMCSDDYYAMNAIKYLREQGLQVPQDVAVVSGHSILTSYLAAQIAIPRTITAVKEEIIQKGRTAACMLLDHLEKNGNGSTGPQQVIFEPKLVVRESCGANLKSK